MFLISQILGIAAVGLYLLSFQLKKRKQIVFTTFVSNGFFVLQYFLLGAYSGAVLDFLSAIFSFLANKKNEETHRKLIKISSLIIMVIMICVGVTLAIIQNKLIELFPVIGAIFQTGRLWFNNEQTIRKCALLGTPFWLIYNYISAAYGAAVGTVLVMISIIVSLKRYKKA